jgi:DNA gyrase/topoisomerase IV subunit A
MFRAKQSFNIFVTERLATADGQYEVKFHNCSVPEVLVKWLKFRLRLEVNSLTWRIGEQEKVIAFTELMLHACGHIDALIKIVRRKPSLTKPEICAAFMKLLKITEPEAKTVMDLRLHQLSSLDQSELEAKLIEQQKALKVLQRDVKRPVYMVRTYLEAMKEQFKFFNGTNPQQIQWILK